MYHHARQQVDATRASRAAGWAVVALAGAMVLAIALEALRAGTREGIHYLAPAILGFGLAGLTALWSRNWHRLLTWPRASTPLLLSRGVDTLVGQHVKGVPLLLSSAETDHSEDHCSRAVAHSSTQVPRSTGHLFLGAIILIPLLAQLVLIAGVQTLPASDWASYWGSAERLLNDGMYVCPVPEGLEFRAHKPPGQTIYLAFVQALFGQSVRAAQLFNVLFILGGNVLFYLVVRRQGSRAVALCATAVFAFWPARNFSVALLSYDAPGSFMVLLFWLLADGPPDRRWPRSLAAGVAAGAAAMFRQTLLVLPLAFALYRWLSGSSRRTTARELLLLSIGLSMVLGPWVYRNYRVLGVPIVTSTMGGPSLYRSFHPDAGRYYTNVGWRDLVQASDGDEVRLNAVAWRRGWQFIIEDPLGAARRVLRNWHRLLESDHETAGMVFDTPSGPGSRRFYELARGVACGVSDVWYAWLALTLLLAGCRKQARQSLGLTALWPLLALASGLAIHGIFESQPRYTVIYQCFWAALAAQLWRPWLVGPRQTTAGYD